MKNCPFCEEEIQNKAEECPFCGELVDIKKTTKIQRDLEKKWLKTLFISAAAIFFLLCMLFFLTGNSDNEGDRILLALEYIFICFIPAIIIGGIITFIKHFNSFKTALTSKIPETLTEKRKSEKTALIFSGIFIIYLIMNGGGFNDDGNIQGAIKNSIALALWIILTVVVIISIRNIIQKNEK